MNQVLGQLNHYNAFTCKGTFFKAIGGAVYCLHVRGQGKNTFAVNVQGS